MKPWLPALLLMLIPCNMAHAEPYSPTWEFTASVAGDSVSLELTTRYVSCGLAGRIDRVVATERVTVWEATGEFGLETVERQVDCHCEPVGSSHGTGRKTCPEEDCTKDEQCTCSRTCAQTLDPCPTPGTLEYELFNLDGILVQTTSLQVPELLPGCAAPVVVEKEEVPVAPATEAEAGGCSAAGGAGIAGLWLLLAALIILALPLPRRLPLLLVAIGGLVAIGCGSKEEVSAEAATPGLSAPLEPVDTNLEGTPWEQVLAAQTELLEHFETAGEPAATMWQVKQWRRDRLNGFKTDCQAALDHYAADSIHRMDFLVKTGRAWSVVQSRIRNISKDWGPAEKHDVGILLTEFECR